MSASAIECDGEQRGVEGDDDDEHYARCKGNNRENNKESSGVLFRRRLEKAEEDAFLLQ